MTLEEVMARSGHNVTHASPYWLATANGLLAEAAATETPPLTQEERARWRLIRATMREREMPL